MLTQLHISNFAIIDKAELEFVSGETVLTGETGAGKSILLGALGLVLGDRAESDTVKEGQERADITASFDIQHTTEVQNWLNEREFTCNDECVLRRVVIKEGRSKAYINDQPVALQSLKELGEMLVNIHGQHEHQTLLKPASQRARLDDYAGHHDLLDKVQQSHKQWYNCNEQLISLRDSEKNKSEKLDLLRFQVQELEALNLNENEYDSLNDEHKRLLNANDLLNVSQQSLNILYENDDQTLHSQLTRINNNLKGLTKLDNNIHPICDVLEAAAINTQEAAELLKDYLEQLDLDPEQLQLTEERMSTIHQLARKHHVEPQQLYEQSIKLKTELDNLERADVRLQELQSEEALLRATYTDHAMTLHQNRVLAAEKLSLKISKSMQKLGMQGGEFKVEIEVKEKNDDKLSKYGIDNIEFLVSTNPGQSTKPLSKIASGGELSRISLAIQMITASVEPVPTLIFDEVDAGIGGSIAEIVGLHLRKLGESRQVMCVTHLPQVAALAHQHFKISKLATTANGGIAKTMQVKVGKLSQTQRIKELARMLGGINITEHTLKHAEEMLLKTATP